MKCKSCGFVDHSTIYASNPPVYKCKKYGCMVRMDSTCKGETNAEEQEAEQTAQQPVYKARTAIQPECKRKCYMGIFRPGNRTAQKIWIWTEKDH